MVIISTQSLIGWLERLGEIMLENYIVLFKKVNQPAQDQLVGKWKRHHSQQTPLIAKFVVVHLGY